MPVEIKIGKHFAQGEFECPCCNLFIYSKKLIDSLDLLREAIGQPLNITSGTRCPDRNKLIGGASNSRHLYGEAADIVAANMKWWRLLEYVYEISAFKSGGIWIYPNKGHIHVDVRTWKSRGCVM